MLFHACFLRINYFTERKGIYFFSIDDKGYVYRASTQEISKDIKFKSATQGLSFEIGVGKNKHFSLTSGIMFSGVELASNKMFIKYTNLEVPVSMKYSAFLGSPLRPHISVGLVMRNTIHNYSELYFLPSYKFADLRGNPIPDDGIPDGAIKPMYRDQFYLDKLQLVSAFGLDYFVNSRLEITSQFRMAQSSISGKSSVTMILASKTLFVGLLYRLHK